MDGLNSDAQRIVRSTGGELVGKVLEGAHRRGFRGRWWQRARKVHGFLLATVASYPKCRGGKVHRAGRRGFRGCRGHALIESVIFPAVQPVPGWHRKRVPVFLLAETADGRADIA